MNYLSEFRKTHQIDKKANLSDISVAVECVAEANEIAFNHMSNLKIRTDAEHFIIYTHMNLAARIYEQVEGMLACIATKCPTSSEALGRIVIEGSINLMYLSRLGNEKSIIAFFSSWTSEHERKLHEWKEKIKNKDYFDAVEPMIDERLTLVSIYKNFIENGIEKFSVNKDEFKKLWPKSIFSRFEALEKEESYYENYHRLSGSSHITAEDTILWLVSLDFSDEQRYKIAQEAWSYSIMMSRLSCLFFIDAVSYSCIRHGLTEGDQLNRLVELKSMVAKSANEIAKAAGVPKI